MSSRFGRIVVFCLCTAVLYLPIFILSIIVAIPLCIIIVGIPVVIVYFVLQQMLFNMTLYAYLHNDDIDYFKAVNIAWRRISNGFLHNVGAFLVVGVISGVTVQVLKFLLNVDSSISNAVSVYDAEVVVFVYSVMYLLVALVCDVLVGVIYFSGGKDENEGYLCG